jgi:hypothetical protein
MTVYLLCFENSAGEHVLFSGHAGHYMGETDKPVSERRDEHQAGRGAKLTAAAARAGITFAVARTWPGRFSEERRLKGRARGSRELKEKCPNCHPQLRVDRWAGGRPDRAREEDIGRPPAGPRPARAATPPVPAQPRPTGYQRGASAALRFLAAQEGRTADEIAATHDYITGPARESARRRTPGQAEEHRGYTDTVARALAELREQDQPPAAATPEGRALAAKLDRGREAAQRLAEHRAGLARAADTQARETCAAASQDRGPGRGTHTREIA